MEARLPQEKLSKICGALESMIGKSKVTLRDLQSLLGLLNLPQQWYARAGLFYEIIRSGTRYTEAPSP